ncbi:flagellar hook-length control protein FliK [Methylococcus sp. EFPC2]|uniref:flagellar hook-length control protein FliK n=1 Tax=Methylococcus sp. EFPC2 TaxID=2812648 RepID=UPI001967269A|nr:flagellar hook-length control protein FliK [Methylococcus sp. EFPC2]QSA95504.1 flagellar hook-length control protein FliK [Methylococcus sp. EFPC2]
MSTEIATLLPAAPVGSSGLGGAQAGADPQAFLRALLQQLQGLGGEPGAADTAPAVPDGSGSETPEDLLSAIMDQLKNLLNGAARTAQDGKEAVGDGKSLPDASTVGELAPTDPASLAGMAEWLAQFINAPQTTVSAQPVGGEGAAALASSAAGGGDLAAKAQAATDEYEHADAGNLAYAVLDMLNRGEKMAAQASTRASAQESPVAQAGAAQDAGLRNEVQAEQGGTLSLDGKEPSVSSGEDYGFQQIMARQVNETAQPGAGAASVAFNPQIQVASSRAAGAESPPGLERPMAHPSWSEDLGDRVLWMVGQGRQSAELKLNPAHLGPLEVRIELNQDQQTSVQFLTHQSAVRDAVESALPKLREMLGAQQLDVRDVGVSQYNPGDQRDPRAAQFAFGQQNTGSGRSETPYPGRDGFVSGSADEGSSAVTTRLRVHQGLLSLYA